MRRGSRSEENQQSADGSRMMRTVGGSVWLVLVAACGIAAHEAPTLRAARAIVPSGGPPVIPSAGAAPAPAPAPAPARRLHTVMVTRNAVCSGVRGEVTCHSFRHPADTGVTRLPHQAVESVVLLDDSHYCVLSGTVLSCFDIERPDPETDVFSVGPPISTDSSVLDARGLCRLELDLRVRCRATPAGPDDVVVGGPFVAFSATCIAGDSGVRCGPQRTLRDPTRLTLRAEGVLDISGGGRLTCATIAASEGRNDVVCVSASRAEERVHSRVIRDMAVVDLVVAETVGCALLRSGVLACWGSRSNPVILARGGDVDVAVVIASGVVDFGVHADSHHAVVCWRDAEEVVRCLGGSRDADLRGPGEVIDFGDEGADRG
jgi:hypothetical protein